MEEIRSSPTRSSRSGVSAASHDDTSASSRMKKDCLSFMVSLREGFHYFTASITGYTKKLRARNEEEATKADLTAEKMQVDAANAAEEAKTRIKKSA